MKKRFKKVFAISLLISSIFAVNAFASDADHHRVIAHNGLRTSIYAYTSWDRAHATRVYCGSLTDSDYGVYYTQTDTITDWSVTATSRYWAA